MERARGFFGKISGRFHKSGAVNATEVTVRNAAQTPMFLTDLDRHVAPSPQAKPYNERRQLAEMRSLTDRIEIARQVAIQPVAIKSAKDLRRWSDLDRTWADIATIQLLQAEKLAEVDERGAESWLEVAIVHTIDIGGELAARRNLGLQMDLARRNGVDKEKVPYLQLLGFLHGLMSSLKIGDVALPDFLSPTAKSPVGRYRFLAQASLAIHRNLYKEIMRDNMDSPKDACPHTMRRVIWCLPNKMGVFLSIDPESLETVYKTARYPLNEIGLSAAQLFRGIRDTREQAYKLLLRPQAEHSLELRQVLQSYLSLGDKEVTTTILYLLLTSGKASAANTHELYRQSRRFQTEGVEAEFFSHLGDAVFSYAKDIAGIAPIVTRDDIVDIYDTNGTSAAELEAASFDQLGSSVSRIFSLSSRRNYTVEPQSIDWKHLATPEAINIEFDANRPRKFTVKLQYNAEQGEPDISFTLDTSKKMMDWNLVEDPMLPENSDIANFKNSLFNVTFSLLQAAETQARAEYTLKHLPQAPGVIAEHVKRERFDDPTYQLRKQMRAEAKEQQKAAEPTKLIGESVSLAALIHEEGVNKQIVLAKGELIDEKFIGVSFPDRERIKKTIKEHNERGVGNIERKSTRPGAEPRYVMDVSCNAPKGARVLMREVKSEEGRRFEVINITYRGKTWRINKLWQK